MSSKDEFLSELYDQLHETPMQRKLRALAPMPVGVVFIEWPGMSMEDIRSHFRTMKELGFTCLKGLMLCPGTDTRAVMHLALDEGIIPWWYDEAGWEEPTGELLEKLGIDPDTPIGELREDPRWLEHQEKVMRERIDRECDGDGGRPLEREFREKFSFDGSLSPAFADEFMDWLKDTYGSIEAVADAWNFHHAGHRRPKKWDNWDDVKKFALDNLQSPHGSKTMYIPRQREYRRLRDVLRFKADMYIQHIERRVAAMREEDPNSVGRAGGEMGLFLPFASRATDMEGIASAMAEGGSFYPSIHLAWHFEEVGFEVARPVYMQASMVADWFKGGWSATWESTGGPQQLSGGKANLYPQMEDVWPGSTVDGGVMTQLMLSYLAAGFRGFGMWCWNARTAGWEAGEFALVDRNGEPCERTRQAGRIGRAAVNHRDEIWQARKEPTVGVFMDFDSDAMWTAASAGGRDFYKRVPVFGRVGVTRALINHNIPWEFVSAKDLRAGLAGRYKVIYLPATLAIANDVLGLLRTFAEQGGRVVLDMPGGWYDDFGRMLNTAAGSNFEAIFGATIRDFQYSRNVPRELLGRRLEGFVVDLGVTTARTVEEYDRGGAGIVENTCGEGSGVLLGWEASLQCAQPGNEQGEADLVRFALGDLPRKFTCQGAIAYRRAAPGADHYFLINDGPETSAMLKTPGYEYTGAGDAVSGEMLELGKPIVLPAYSGRWVRMAK
ncbi:MAG: beta-galactosidase trimerization domain-containing protein [Phycisphaerae bacterium]